jgi:hypothetical protein
LTDLYDISELRNTFTRKCIDKFSYLDAYGFKLEDIKETEYRDQITYKSETTGIKISLEIRDNQIFVYLIRLINGSIPAYLDAPSRWFYLDNIVKFRSPSATLPRKGFGDLLTADDIDYILSEYALALKEYGEDVLRGNFSIFTELARLINRPKRSSNEQEFRTIRSQEELVAQQERLPAQIVEYYDTYFSELRRQLQNSDLPAESVPAFLKGLKRVISIGSKDGVVVAHFPIDLDITMSETNSGRTLIHFPAMPDATEDSYSFLQFPGSPVRDIVKFISGGEDVDMEIPAQSTSWGVRTFAAPQLKADRETDEITWQATWTRLVAADLHHLKYWEATERALIEAREDLKEENLKFYLRALQLNNEPPTHDMEAEVPEDTESYLQGAFGQILMPEQIRVEDMEFTAFKQAA